jgi:hypothetical protein
LHTLFSNTVVELSFYSCIIGHPFLSVDTVINALFRILREDCKKSTLLTKNILNILLDFARFKQFQGILLANKIYQLTLDIVDFELERCERWKVQLQALEVEANESASGSVPNDFRMWASLDERINVQNSLLTGKT